MTAAYPFVALGGLVPLRPTVQWSLLRRIFSAPVHPYHGLGIGSLDLLRSFPWVGCDASSWDYHAIFWRSQGWPDKGTPRRQHIHRLLASERQNSRLAIQQNWPW